MNMRLVVLGLIALLAVVGCGQTQSGLAPNQPSGSQTGGGGSTTTNVTLTLLIDNDTNRDGIAAVAEFIEKKTGIKTKFEIRPGGAEGDNVVKTRLATGDTTDLFYYNSGSLFQALNPEQNFVDLTNEPFMANVMDSFKATVSANGKVYGIPGGPAVAGGWLYNKKVYAELGLQVPKTWTELMQNNEKIKAAGKIPVIGSYKTDWTTQLILLADYYNLQAQVPNFAQEYTANRAKFATTPAALRGFEKLEEVYRRGFLNKDFLATDYDTALKMLVEGTGVHYPMLTLALDNIRAKYPNKVDDIGFFGQPGDTAEKHGVTVWMPAGIYLNKRSKNIEAAKKWMELFVSPEGVAAYLSRVKPVGPFVIKGVQMPEDTYAAVKDLVKYFDSGNTAPALEFLSPVKGPNLPQITTEVGAGLKTAKQGAEEYDRDVEKQAKQLKLPGW